MFFDWIIFKIFPVTNYVKYPTQAYRSKSILSWASDRVRLLELFWTISILKSRFTSTLSWTMTRNCHLSSVHFWFGMNNVLFSILAAVILSCCSDVHNIFDYEKKAFTACSIPKKGAEGEVFKEAKTPVLYPALLTKIRRFRRFDVSYLFHFWVKSKFFGVFQFCWSPSGSVAAL